uniref:Uncharacterized protein n=1 Tax=Anguilla anguilla TaxID=7936 RepID=A0A0E9TBV7_ANGAN
MMLGLTCHVGKFVSHCHRHRKVCTGMYFTRWHSNEVYTGKFDRCYANTSRCVC